jgi:hypothetical protein
LLRLSYLIDFSFLKFLNLQYASSIWSDSKTRA